jgi:hypothetical protein
VAAEKALRPRLINGDCEDQAVRCEKSSRIVISNRRAREHLKHFFTQTPNQIGIKACSLSHILKEAFEAVFRAYRFEERKLLLACSKLEARVKRVATQHLPNPGFGDLYKGLCSTAASA